MTDAELLAGAHANLAAWARVYAEHNHGRITIDAGLQMTSIPLDYPGFRSAVVVGPLHAGSMAVARSFFAEDPDAFVVFARPEDLAVLSGPGVAELFQAPQMVCTEPVDDPRPPGGATVSLSTDRDDLREYAAVAGRAFAELAFPADQTAASLDIPSLLTDERVALGVARVDGHLVAGALSVTEGDGSYVSYVAAGAEARRRGLGDAVTRLVTNAGFDRGASFASLEASPFGYDVYERMGYREIRKYHLLVVTD
jgi:ribosomal protein S18 acetylase RimI-like enzyme